MFNQGTGRGIIEQGGIKGEADALGDPGGRRGDCCWRDAGNRRGSMMMRTRSDLHAGRQANEETRRGGLGVAAHLRRSGVVLVTGEGPDADRAWMPMRARNSTHSETVLNYVLGPGGSCTGDGARRTVRVVPGCGGGGWSDAA